MADLPLIGTAAALIEFGGAVIVVTAVVRALTALVTGGGITAARLLVISGSLSGLGYKSAATLLKAIELGTWRGIGMFAAIFTLRTLIKRTLTWEQGGLEAGAGTARFAPVAQAASDHRFWFARLRASATGSGRPK